MYEIFEILARAARSNQGCIRKQQPRGNQEQPGAAKGSQEQPGAARRAARSSQESSQEQPGAARSSQEPREVPHPSKYEKVDI